MAAPPAFSVSLALIGPLLVLSSFLYYIQRYFLFSEKKKKYVTQDARTA